VNTFVPCDDVEKCARELDWRRLGKQRVEAYQIWRALKGYTRGWRNHPAARAWEGHECALAVYCNAMIREWINRGYRNRMEFLPHGESPEFPWWWGWMPVHMSHRAALNRKLSSYYKYEVGEYADWGYVWPSEVSPELRCIPDPSPESLKIKLCERGFEKKPKEGISLKASGTTKREMASYGRQFELLMTSIGIDLINAYNSAEQPGDVAEFVRNFFNSEKSPGTPPHFPRPSSPEAAPAKKGKAAKGKGAPKKETTPPPDEKRCEAKTAKGARCMKCAKEGEVFCSVHLKSAAPSKAKGKEKVKEPEPEPEPEPEAADEAESSSSRAAQILQQVSKKAEEPVTSKTLKPARPSKKKKAEEEPIPPPPPLARAEPVKPSWFEDGEEEFEEDGEGADDDPSWEAGTEDGEETQAE